MSSLVRGGTLGTHPSGNRDAWDWLGMIWPETLRELFKRMAQCQTADASAVLHLI